MAARNLVQAGTSPAFQVQTACRHQQCKAQVTANTSACQKDTTSNVHVLRPTNMCFAIKGDANMVFMSVKVQQRVICVHPSAPAHTQLYLAHNSMGISAKRGKVLGWLPLAHAVNVWLEKLTF